MSGTFSWVRARLVEVAKKPDQSQRKLRKVLTGSSMVSESSSRISRDWARSGDCCGHDSGILGVCLLSFGRSGSSSSGVAGS